MIKPLLYLFSILSVAQESLASDPLRGCRVKAETLKNFGTLTNNAGCVISRGEGESTDILVVFTGKRNESGNPLWELPGGTPSSKKADGKIIDSKPISEETKAISDHTPFDYTEPAVCTASREAYEETGKEVIIEDLVLQTNNFVAFRCRFAQPVDSSKISLKDVNDKNEIKEIRWAKKSEVLSETFWRYPDNLPITRAFFAR